MAIFNININQYILPYEDVVKNIVEESCDTITKVYPIGVTDTSVGANPSILFLAYNYTGNPKTTLHIKNVSYKTDGVTTTGNDFSLKYNSIKLSGAGVTSIDITSTADGFAVTNLELSSNVIYGEINGKSITFDYVIEDANGKIGPYTTTIISLALIRCTTIVNPVITNASSIIGDHDCGTYQPTAHYFTVTLQEGENLSMRYRNTIRGLGGFNGIIRRLSVCCQDPSVGIDPYTVISGMVPTDPTGPYKKVIYNPIVPSDSAHSEPWNVVHIQIFLCILRMYGDDAVLANTHEVEVDILNALGEVVHTITLNESKPGI